MSDRCWTDGRVVSARDPAARAGSDARADGPVCYTTARWTGRDVRFASRHVARLARDAATLELGRVDRDEARRALSELGRTVFGEGEGVVRLQASRGTGGRARLLGTTRPVGPEPGRWRAITVDVVHEGAVRSAGAKVANRPVIARAAERVAAAGVEEALLFDAAERLVEGQRANLVFVTADGVAAAPPAERGAVAGVALEVACDRVRDLARRDLARAALGELRELVALNAVRGAVPIVAIDGRPVGDGRPGPWAARLAAALDAAD